MKEIKAYIRPDAIEPVIRELEIAGARDLTIIRVDAFGAISDANESDHHLFHKYAAKYSAVTKLEIVCPDADVSRFTKIVQKLAYTGAHGDGRIFVSDIDAALNIRTGAEGEAAL